MRRKRKIWPVPFVLLVLLLGVVGVVVLVSGSHHTTHKVAASSATPTVAPTVVPTAPTTFSWTDPNTGVTANVDSPKVDQAGNAGKIPSAGKEFVILPATVHNGGSREASYFGLDFSAYDQSDNEYKRVQETMYPPKDGKYIGFGALSKGQTRSGMVVFELPLNTPMVRIKWDDSQKISPPKTLGTFHLG